MSDRSLAVYFALVALAFVLFLAFALRPSVVLGVDGETLVDSVNEGEVFPGANEPCREVGEGWRCLIYESSSSSASNYFVTVDGWGCWEARPWQRRSAPATYDGCITLLNH